MVVGLGQINLHRDKKETTQSNRKSKRFEIRRSQFQFQISSLQHFWASFFSPIKYEF